jgi:hypothetical protein
MDTQEPLVRYPFSQDAIHGLHVVTAKLLSFSAGDMIDGGVLADSVGEMRNYLEVITEEMASIQQMTSNWPPPSVMIDEVGFQQRTLFVSDMYPAQQL